MINELRKMFCDLSVSLLQADVVVVSEGLEDAELLALATKIYVARRGKSRAVVSAGLP